MIPQEGAVKPVIERRLGFKWEVDSLEGKLDEASGGLESRVALCLSDFCLTLKVQVRVWSTVFKDLAALEGEFELNPSATLGRDGHMERAHMPPGLQRGFARDLQERSHAPLRGRRMERIDVPFLLHLREAGVPLERQEELLHQVGTLGCRDKHGTLSHITVWAASP